MTTIVSRSLEMKDLWMPVLSVIDVTGTASDA
jgi:hypothetical protein